MSMKFPPDPFEETHHGDDIHGPDLYFYVHADFEAWKVVGTTTPNPPVGCVLVSRDGRIIGTGATQPAGGPHAEIMALRDAEAAGEKVEDCRAVVTLEPCNHTGRTGPCAQALYEAGVVRVDYLFADPNPKAQGGGDFLRSKGLDVRGPSFDLDDSMYTIPVWATETWVRAQAMGRPHVTLKVASTLDGFAAATDGSSQWITSEASRTKVHKDRALREAIIVGTGTVVADNPRLTARNEDGQPGERQPLRVVMGRRDLDSDANIFHAPGETIQIRSRDPREVLKQLADRGVVDVLVEGGPQIAQAFLEADLVDLIQLYQAPSLLFAGQPAFGANSQSTTMADIRRFTSRSVEQFDQDVLRTLTRTRSE